MDDAGPDQSPTIVENGITLYADPETGAVRWGERLDARSDLKSFDEIVEPPPSPPGGWGPNVVLVNGRPIKPLDQPFLQAGRPPCAVAVPTQRPVKRPSRRPGRASVALARVGAPAPVGTVRATNRRATEKGLSGRRRPTCPHDAESAVRLTVAAAKNL